MFREKFGKLFRYYRKKYQDVNQLLKTDETHRFFDAGLHQPVCSIRTMYYIEQGYYNNDDDVLIFLVGKFGFEYYQDETTDKLIETLLKDVLTIIQFYQFEKLENVKARLEKLNVKNKFLYHLHYQLIKAVIDLYYYNSYTTLKDYIKHNYPFEALFPYGDTLDAIIKFNYYLYIDFNYCKVNEIVNNSMYLNRMDRKIAFIAQQVNNQLYKDCLMKITKEMENYSLLVQKHFQIKIKLVQENRQLRIDKLNYKAIEQMIIKQDKYHCILALNELVSSNNKQIKKLCKKIIQSIVD